MTSEVGCGKDAAEDMKGPECMRDMEIMERTALYGICFSVCFRMVATGMDRLVRKYDGGHGADRKIGRKEKEKRDGKSRLGVLLRSGVRFRIRWRPLRILSVIAMTVILGIPAQNCTGAQDAAFYGVFSGSFAGCLYFACISDIAMLEVYDMCWWLAIPAAFIWLARSEPGVSVYGELAFYFLFQQKILSKSMGRADCHAFCACAVMEAGLGMGLAGFLEQTVIAYGALILVQAARRNINGRGRLRKPVAFVPYIAFAFFLNILHFSQGF